MKDETLERLMELGIELTDGIRDCHIRDVNPEAQEAWAAQVIGAAELDPEVAAGGPLVLSDIATPGGEPYSGPSIGVATAAALDAVDLFDMAFVEMDDERMIEILEGVGAKALELAHKVRADGVSAVTDLIREVPEPELFLRWGRAIQGAELPTDGVITSGGLPSKPAKVIEGIDAPVHVTPLPREPRRRRVNIQKRCTGTTQAGAQCRRKAIVGDNYCPQHGGKKPKAKPTAKAKS